MFSVIFEVHPHQGRKDEYLGYAKMLKPMLEQIDGFIDNERFESRTRPGWVLSLSTWRDEKSVIRWRTHARHHEIQEKGRFEVFSDYHLRVGEVTADTHPPEPVREQRFDATETGSSRLCTVIEATPRHGSDLPKAAAAMLRAIGAGDGVAGLNDSDVYDSIYNPGKVLVLLSWADPANAAAFRPQAIAEAATTRSRAVRVIRDYGMADRREATQYYPKVGQPDGTRAE